MQIQSDGCLKMKATTLYDVVDFRLAFCKEMIDGNGEDSFFADMNERYSIIAAFDGCGGLGAKEYRNFSGKTGAYMASRIVSGATKSWFDAIGDKQIQVSDYKMVIDSAFSVAKAHTDTGGKFKGSMQKNFPTTLSVAVSSWRGKAMETTFIWAGDSRGYILDADGLHQVTTDDIDGEDAMSNLSNDGVMTNVVHMDGKYELHTKTVHSEKPALIFCATDGCFGYVSTPMEFEYLLLETLSESQSPEDWEKRLYEAIGAYAGDDYTLSLLSVGFGDFSALKKSLAKRKTFMLQKYIANIENKTYEEKVQLWNHYKPSYEYK